MGSGSPVAADTDAKKPRKAKTPNPKRKASPVPQNQNASPPVTHPRSKVATSELKKTNQGFGGFNLMSESARTVLSDLKMILNIDPRITMNKWTINWIKMVTGKRIISIIQDRQFPTRVCSLAI